MLRHSRRGAVSGIREVGAAVRHEAILEWIVATITIGNGGVR